jgi:hypothetical protein
MKREEKRKIGFIFRVNLNSDGVYFNWGWVNFLGWVDFKWLCHVIS